MKSLLHLVILISVLSCQKNQLVEKSDLFRDAIATAFEEYKNIPFLQTDAFSDFSDEEIKIYRELGINIWKKDELFMRGIYEFISIQQVELKNSVLEINYFYYSKDQEPLTESLQINIKE